MGRPTRDMTEFNAAMGWGPLRQHWQAMNRQNKKAAAQQQAKHKARGQRRAKCGCAAYPWPHRPGGGLCRNPDPPLERWQPKAGSRPFRNRYAGLRRQIARSNGLHPIKDRAAIDALMPQVLALAKQLHRQHPKYKYRNIEIIENGVRGNWQTAGPMM